MANRELVAPGLFARKLSSTKDAGTRDKAATVGNGSAELKRASAAAAASVRPPAFDDEVDWSDDDVAPSLFQRPGVASKRGASEVTADESQGPALAQPLRKFNPSLAQVATTQVQAAAPEIAPRQVKKNRVEATEYPSVEFVADKETLDVREEDGLWLKRVLDLVFERELEELEAVFGREKPKVMERLRELCKRVSRKAGALPELSNNHTIPQQPVNPKNAELHEREAKLRRILEDYELDIREWLAVEAERTRPVALAGESAEHSQAAVKSEDGSHAESDAKPANDADSGSPAGYAEASAAEQLASPNELQRRLKQAIAELRFSNAKLKSAQRMASRGQAASKRLATMLGEEAFRAFDGARDARNLIRKLTEPAKPAAAAPR